MKSRRKFRAMSMALVVSTVTVLSGFGVSSIALSKQADQNAAQTLNSRTDMAQICLAPVPVQAVYPLTPP
ncbi:hypothetical protein [Alicyclobacillus sp. SP_1]|uniref:hypothetical protein n=1 Tax=Alicyclobacillus sp. SP_1 TaxID=2942475 RepID=UPI0021576127|nr:hypothetical protein [Alicyclobacillus sp. SP_1]